MGGVGVGHGHMITKRPRGRPKGSGTKDKGSTGNIIHSSGTEPCVKYTCTIMYIYIVMIGTHFNYLWECTHHTHV